MYYKIKVGRIPKEQTKNILRKTQKTVICSLPTQLLESKFYKLGDKI